ncbi:GL21965 [Drosophila persimilis]|uniref:GL21965 n=1 Tax=Drosophila persimilis TaxID=7234 RepID=B4GE66_DROPE|nr:GL21965 [Drosophila persimilis]
MGDAMNVKVKDIETLFSTDGYLRPFEREIRRRYDPPKPGLLKKKQAIGEFDLPYAEEIIKKARTNEEINPLRIKNVGSKFSHSSISP